MLPPLYSPFSSIVTPYNRPVAGQQPGCLGRLPRRRTPLRRQQHRGCLEHERELHLQILACGPQGLFPAAAVTPGFPDAAAVLFEKTDLRHRPHDLA